MGKISRIVTVLLLFIIVLPVFSESTGLTDFLQEVNALLYWNPVTETGCIQKNNCVVLFKIDTPWLIFDYSLLVKTGEWKRDKNGTILLPVEAAATIKKYFAENADEVFVPKVACIMIDPGHGGTDPGAIGTHKTKSGSFKVLEKDVVLEVGTTLYAMLKEKYTDKKIVLTRSDDTFLKLEERTNLANSIPLKENEAIIFVSIHANASFNTRAKGFEVWYLPIDYRRDLIDEKKLDEDEKNILPILNTMLEEEFSIESITLAQSIIESMSRELGGISESRGTKAESWFVVRNAKMPSVLIEVGFVTNPEEAALLNDSEYLKKLSASMYNGIINFVSKFEKTKGFTE
ncbi:MAG: N-acetylmuramoyl-L-alanine amidase [Spirochaetales bacterium]|nr:N-acetylmuramoyl-L-alanine amidase [Spirochaetales bacterium]